MKIWMCTLSTVRTAQTLIITNQPYPNLQKKKKANKNPQFPVAAGSTSRTRKGLREQQIAHLKASLPQSPAGLQSQANGQSCPLCHPLSSCSSCTGHWLPLWWASPLLFRCPLTCAVPSEQQNPSWLSSPTAKTHWPNLFRQLDL